ncbi:MAG TPA: efflux RND transporter permease subunit, partial [Thermomicrobiales bacterium]|nr:efflux RND transporter permease subunit [Thermomicrobiales bacterium]
NGVAWLDAIHSESVTGLSRIQLIFEPGTDLMRARQVVQERLTQAHALPNVSSPPQMIDPLSSTGRVMMIRFSSDTVNPIQMSVLARWVVKPRLLGVNGVANVSIFGQRERQIQVLVDPQQLRSRNVTLLDVITTAGNALWVSPLSFLEASTPGTGGFIDTPNQRLSIQHLLPIKKASDLAQAPMAASGDTQLLRLGDVASVVEDHQPLIGDAISDAGVNDLLFVIEKAPDANVRDVTAGIEAALTALGPGLNGVSIDRSLYRPASYLDAAMANLAPALLAGAVLLVLALGAALWDWRAAAIGAATIPLALVAATFVLALRGLTFNARLLVGLVVALGAIVGDVAADVAAVRRRLRPRPDEATLSVGEAVHAAAQETRGPAVYGALILLLALVPTFLVAFLGGVPSALFGPIAQAYALALAASLAIALTLTPALAWFLYAWFPVGQGAAPGAQLRAAYHRLVAALAMRPGWSWVLLAAFIAAGVLAAPFLRTAMTPTFQDRDLLIHWEGAPGVSLPEMSRITTL